MRLLGAKEFLKTVKPGTLCIEFWKKSEEECLHLIKDYETGSTIYQLLEKYGGEFYIFGDNSGSLSFLYSDNREEDDEVEINGFKYDCLFYYDKNIVGDASPTTTLQLVFENEDEWPEKIYPEDYDHESINKILNKDDIKRIIKWFLKECGPFTNETSEAAWALKSLEKEKNNVIINYKGGLIMKDKNNLEPSDYKTWVSDTCNSPLNAALNNLYARASVHCPIDEISIILDELHLIENALKEYETRKTFIETIDSGEMVFEPRNVWEEKQKKLKAFEIIKKKRVNIGSFIKCCANINYEEYKKQWGNWHKDILYNLSQEALTREEYDLLKEVLK